MTNLLEALDKIESQQLRPEGHYSKYTSVQAPLILKLVAAVRELILFVDGQDKKYAEKAVMKAVEGET